MDDETLIEIDHEETEAVEGIPFEMLPAGATGDIEVDTFHGLLPAPELPPVEPPLTHVLEELAEKDRPPVLPACATCPAAMWSVRVMVGQSVQSLECYCEQKHQVTYDSVNAVALVVKCDGRQKLLAALLEALKPEADHAPSIKNKP